MLRGLPPLVVGLGLALLLAPMPVLAEDGDFDRLERADVMQEQALAAAEAGDWETARSLAEAVLTLDDSYATAPSRYVLVRALEYEKSYEAALYELKRYLEVEDLTEADRKAALRARDRIEAKGAGTWRGRKQQARPPSARTGVALMIGGAATLVLGTGFVGVDVRWASLGVQSGTWAAIGAPLLAAGLALDVVGLITVLRATTGGPKSTAARLRRPALFLGVTPTAGGWMLSLGTSW